MFKLRIENSYRILPCYTADVSGVCSALYELGGMVVMHDPSGCNSTYNTHDETRWYDHDSLIYITGLTDIDAIMGNDNKVVGDVCDAAARLNPRFIALCGSPIPYINGFDYHAVAGMIERRSGICTFAVETNGVHDYIQGAGQALLKYAERYLAPKWNHTLKDPRALPHGAAPLLDNGAGCGRTGELCVNLLGATPLDFAASGSMGSIRKALADRNIYTVCCFALDMAADTGSPDGAVQADANLVISAAGLPVAEYMFKNYGIPYAVGLPVGRLADKVCRDLRMAAEKGVSGGGIISCCIREPDPTVAAAGPSAALIGEPVAMGSMASAIALGYGIRTSLLCPLEGSGALLTGYDHSFRGEKQCTELMEQFDHVIADPLYKAVCPRGTAFHSLPHAAFSGRCCLDELQDIVRLFE